MQAYEVKHKNKRHPAALASGHPVGHVFGDEALAERYANFAESEVVPVEVTDVASLRHFQQDDYAATVTNWLESIGCPELPADEPEAPKDAPKPKEAPKASDAPKA